jgi:hypothetical protein
MQIVIASVLGLLGALTSWIQFRKREAAGHASATPSQTLGPFAALLAGLAWRSSLILPGLALFFLIQKPVESAILHSCVFGGAASTCCFLVSELFRFEA